MWENKDETYDSWDLRATTYTVQVWGVVNKHKDIYLIPYSD